MFRDVSFDPEEDRSARPGSWRRLQSQQDIHKVEYLRTQQKACLLSHARTAPCYQSNHVLHNLHIGRAYVRSNPVIELASIPTFTQCCLWAGHNNELRLFVDQFEKRPCRVYYDKTVGRETSLFSVLLERRDTAQN